LPDLPACRQAGQAHHVVLDESSNYNMWRQQVPQMLFSVSLFGVQLRFLLGGHVPYQVKLEAFEGPFDLLLSLISRQKVDIYEISLATIIKDYLEYLDEMKILDLEVVSEFLVIAATLLQIKAGFLLASDSDAEEEEISVAETRDLLVARLLEYKKFKNASEALIDLMQSQRGFCKREGELEKRVLARSDFLEGIAKEDLAYVLVALFFDREKGNPVIRTDHILAPPVNLNDKIGFVLRKLRNNGRETFLDLTKSSRTRIDAAVTFLALLELYRRRLITIRQMEIFGEIVVELLKDVEELPMPEEYMVDGVQKMPTVM